MKQLLLIVFLTLGFAHADPVRIMVLDTAVDQHHEAIEPFIDHPAMDSFTVNPKLTNGKTLTLTEYTDSEFKKNTDVVDHLKFKELLSDITFLNDRIDEMTISQFIGDLAKLIIKSRFSNRLKVETAIFGAYFHGTHVSALSVNSNLSDQVKLSVYPFRLSNDYFVEMKRDAGTKRYRFKYSQIEKTIDHYGIEAKDVIADDIIQYIHKNKIQVVNASLGMDWEHSQASIAMLMKRLAPMFHDKDIRELNERDGKSDLAQIKKIINGCPDTVFVFAAGNEKLDVSKKNPGYSNIRDIQAPNLIYVAATQGPSSKELAKFSNRGAQYVQIAAFGQEVPSAKAGTKDQYIKLSGTSMASPIVVSQIAKLLTTMPTHSKPQEIIAEFFKTTSKAPELLNDVEEGRVLKLPESMFEH